MKINKLILVVLLGILFSSCNEQENTNNHIINKNGHPSLILTQKGVQEIRSQLGKVPLFDSTLARTKKEVDAEIEKGILVPIPKDMAGGYTHEQHKKNYLTLQKAGFLYQILDDEKYALYVKNVLNAYAKMFPTLGRHPQKRSYARGKLFWQCLNDANWLVYTSQAYDCVYDYLSADERKNLEENLFKPYADFLSVETPQFFNRIHNHSTWGNVAVGMIGLVMNDDELLNRALFGLQSDNLDANAKDNDGGLIKPKGQKAGFYANLDEPFSPDGYYTEGPYYQRYAMYPFMIFAQALENKKPELKIFEYKNGVLLKAVDALLNLSNSKGGFYPLNDAQKGMSIFASSLVSAVDIAYYYGKKPAYLLSVAKQQNAVQLDQSGLAVAQAIRDGKAEGFEKKTILLTDGANGNEGGVGILRCRNKNVDLSLVFKFTSQGLSHGHFDKLSTSFYQNGEEFIQDYGLARFVNVEQKNGGGYLKENKTWAKQSIAHNTLIQDETSHFKGKYSIGMNFHSDKYFFDTSNQAVQVISAIDTNAYPGTKMHRSLFFVDDSYFKKPFIIDIMKVNSNALHQYDFPFYYLGQIIDANFKYSTPATLKPLGKKNGYQHLWLEGIGKANDENSQFTWKLNNHFYSITSLTSAEDQILLARIGANDPEFNLRRDPALIFRKAKVKNALFASVIEAHGSYSPVSEFAKNAYPEVKEIKVLLNNQAYTILNIKLKDDKECLICLASKDNSTVEKHKVKIHGLSLEWTGPFYYKSNKK